MRPVQETRSRKRDGGKPVPLYVVTGGRSQAPESGEWPVLDLVTLVVATAAPQPGMPPEQADLLRSCRRPLSVAELSAHLALPFSAVVVLLTDLHQNARVELRQTRPPRGGAVADPDVETLKALIDGLQRL
ncbi:DUF742 domain-containing protein [Streptomyces hoynatensis]|uniref:DUF742 domain-containing protein n=1 Tax=Streptomyces hoynatensis TaxID=1141874 RepID=A0A3A9ZD16_9ACTN|nr:DUF742 domain-containing protein [Streptomyces hoynatensis]RKN45939.1 DUF742 domain-containing protein [Streptomyces hoynatensis]